MSSETRQYEGINTDVLRRMGRKGEEEERDVKPSPSPPHRTNNLLWVEELDSMRNHYRCALRMGREKRRRGGG